MFGGRKDFRRWLYRFLPAKHSAFYPARRRGLDHWATRGGRDPVAATQKAFVLRWVGTVQGIFEELDAGDGLIGSHAVWLEEAGWKGLSQEDRGRAAALLKKNRPGSVSSPRVAFPAAGADLVSARRVVTIRHLVEGLAGRVRPRWLILQARDPQPEIFRAVTLAGYRLDNFIHDDEYYRLQRN